MDQRNMSMGGETIDWNDPAFSTSEFQDSMIAESPYGNSAFNDFTNLADYSDSPAALNFRTPSKSGPDPTANAAAQQPGLTGAGSTPAESSSQDSASDSSSRRKRKTTESPISDPTTDGGLRNAVKSEDMGMGTSNFQNNATYQHTFNQQPLPNLNVDASMVGNDDVFDFESAASSPNLPRDFNQQLSLDAKMQVPTTASTAQFTRGSPVTTINPGMFTLGGASRDQSPVANSMMYNTASPNAIFSTPSSDSNEYNVNPNWNTVPNTVQNPTWSSDFNSQFASPGGLAFTPSPVTANGTPAMSKRAAVSKGRSKLHIAPISTKSRVETQINVVMTLETAPPNIEYLHLPLHTIAKSKLLAKDDVEKSRTLELHTMLVCTSAMHHPQMKEKALQRAAKQNNNEIQKRGEEMRKIPDEEKNSTKDIDDADKAANGGEVRICNNCIQRERKRAGRKKLKREEEQQHWERFETERVVVFNSNEYLPFKPFEASQQPQKEGGMGMDEPYNAPEGAVSAAAAMRIACYCRHQSEKEGFQVIFTLKDQKGNVVAQEMSDSILITDDHKTHPPALTPMSSDMIFPQNMQYTPNGLPTSYSMVNLSSHAHPFTSSRSTGNLQGLGFSEQQYNPHSHIHQLQTNQPYASQTTSATMTPTSLSRPGSPNSAGQSGPNKKRKSSNFGVPAHRRLPSGLQMTPRVDAGSQPPSATGQPTMNIPQNFSPNGPSFPQQNDQSFMTIPQNNGPAQYYGSGPPTPANEQAPFSFGHPHQLDIARAQNASAYFSHPGSAVPSRSNSPVLQQRQFARNPVQTSTNHVSRPSQQMYGGQSGPGAQPAQDAASNPTITKITPSEGPITGGTEVSIFGYNFTHSIQVFFGSTLAAATYYGSQCILAISPPGQRGPVQVRLANSAGTMQYTSPQTSNPLFTYTDTNARMMEMALRYLSQQQTGDPSRWVQYTNEVANQFMQTSISPAGIPNQGYDGGNMMAVNTARIDDAECAVVEEDEKEAAFGSQVTVSQPSVDPDGPKMTDEAAAAWLLTSIMAYRALSFSAVIPYIHTPAATSLPAFGGARAQAQTVAAR